MEKKTCKNCIHKEIDASEYPCYLCTRLPYRLKKDFWMERKDDE